MLFISHYPQTCAINELIQFPLPFKKQEFGSIRPFFGDNEIKRKKKSMYLCQFGAPPGQSLGLLSQLPNIATV